ncbi:pyridine nucleotide-disulfide oxidoreductasefamily protein [Lichtheimia corymbifera JMRC:FSU:9682]|uniref:Pyridine nucleotide-disulfide oxidoreductasefamily protein n=1 Tax=Lichtheimia corymbifera JMRC:FSU:9682 TaxID=1263082 RepID=A0A068RVX1_9FUNG|nr:pyridine nucleotide-disulfide oxidoreductasefamily protein [Lichtheimia corymbifera JMRC:FSU:9682]
MRYDNSFTNFEVALNRIYKSFLSDNANLKLHSVTTKEQVEQDMEGLHWAIIRREDAVKILEETERQVLANLRNKLDDFIRLKQLDISDFDHGPSKPQIRVVIVGGGFTGFTVASILDPMPLFHVTVIDTKDSFEYTPGIIKKLVNPEESSSMRVRHDSYVKNGRVLIGFASNVNDDVKSLQVNGETVDFDYLVVATGSSYSSQLKSTDMSVLYRITGLEQVNAELINARRILIVGGGLVGCELASEIALRTFPGKYPRKEITLVESHDKIIRRTDDYQRERAMDYLQNLGIEVICNDRIVDLEGTENGGNYLGASGRIYSGYDKVFMATGTRPNSQILQNSGELDACVDSWGRIMVKPSLQIDHYKCPHIFAGGDVTNVIEEKTGYAATLAGVCIARNICRLVKGKAPLRQGTKGTMPAPDKPLHGIHSQGGIGKQRLGLLKKKFAFLNPAWAALKLFDEQQYLRMVQGEAMNSSQVFGRMPRKLGLPHGYAYHSPIHSYSLASLEASLDQHIPQSSTSSVHRHLNHHQQQQQQQSSSLLLTPTPRQTRSCTGGAGGGPKREYKTWSASSTRLSSISHASSSGSSSGSSTSSLHDFVNSHFTFGKHALEPQRSMDNISRSCAKHQQQQQHHHRQQQQQKKQHHHPRHFRRSSMPSVTNIEWATPSSLRSVKI